MLFRVDKGKWLKLKSRKVFRVKTFGYAEGKFHIDKKVIKFSKIKQLQVYFVSRKHNCSIDAESCWVKIKFEYFCGPEQIRN